MSAPPPLRLPTPPELCLRALPCSWGATLDLSGWFTQLPLHRDIRPFFGVRAHSGRYLCTSTPMGWSFGPGIGQGAAQALLTNLLAPVSTVLWIDNILVTGATAAAVTAGIQEILARCSAAQVVVNHRDSVLTPARCVTFVGLHLDLVCCLPPGPLAAEGVQSP